MTSRLMSLALRIWPRTGQIAATQQSWATADLWRRVIAASEGGDEDAEAVAEALDRLAAEAEEEEVRQRPPAASEEAVAARKELIREHYRALVNEGPAAARSPFDGTMTSQSPSRTAEPEGVDAGTGGRARSMRERVEQQVRRPNLDIPIGENYVTLAQ